MAMIKGKFITMACSLLELNPKAKLEVAQGIKDMTSMEWKDLPPEDWFEAQVQEYIFKVVEKHNSPVMAASIIKAMGRRVFPTISKTIGFPKDLKTPRCGVWHIPVFPVLTASPMTPGSCSFDYNRRVCSRP